jgi:hypothetical protein
MFYAGLAQKEDVIFSITLGKVAFSLAAEKLKKN